MVQYIHTPYPSPSHLLSIRSHFYPPPSSLPPLSNNLKEEAVARVALWSHRGSCPHLVESTALLTAVILSDTTNTTSPSTLRAAYASAFSRFVTGLLDSHQDKARKQSMYDVAKSVGLPAKFVELRHMGVHEGLPSLCRLRRGAEEGLEWIYQYYWAKLEAEVEDVRMEDGEEEKEGVMGEEEKCEGLVRRYLDLGETMAEKMRKDILMEQMRGFGIGMVREVVEKVTAGSSDGKVVRRGMALSRLLDEENGEGMVIEEPNSKRGTVPEAGEDVNMAEVHVISEPTTVQPQPIEERLQPSTPSWVLYDEASWVPKPIGVVLMD